MIIIRPLILAVILQLLYPHLVIAEVKINEIFTHYAINPDSVEQIKLELREKSPVSKAHQLFHGGTQWKLVPKFALIRRANRCFIEQIAIELDGTYILPEMKNRDTAPVSTIEHFDQYYAALMEHEKGHQRLWIQAGNEIEQTLKMIQPLLDCKPLAEQAKRLVTDTVLKYQQLNQSYDKDTGHGKTQGVFISP